MFGGGQDAPRAGSMAADDLPQNLRNLLRQLVDELEKQTDESYREEVATALKHRHFWAGRHHLVYEPALGVFDNLAPLTAEGPKDDDPYEPLRLVVNHWQARGLSTISVLSESEPNLKWSAREPGSDDETRAKAFQLAHAYYMATNGGPRLLQSFRALRQWTDGAYYVRMHYVPDGERFGYKSVPILAEEEQQITPDVLSCSACGEPSPVEGSLGVCPACNAPLGPEALVPGERAPVMVQRGVKKVPKGTVKADVYGILEVRHPLFGRSVRDWGWLCFSRELERYAIRAKYPQLIETLGKAGDENASSDSSLWARNARISLATGAACNSLPDLVTEARWYLRPEVFLGLDKEEDRQELKRRFPKGVIVVYADGRHVEAKPGSIDDEWVSCLGLPEEGARALAVGASSITPQEILNKAYSIETEAIEFELPVTIVNDQFISRDQLRAQRAFPGATLTGKVPAGMSVEDCYKQVRAGGATENLVQLRRDMSGSVMDETSAAVPAVWGGDSGGAGETYRGYMAQQSAAKGKLSMPWQQMTLSFADEARLAVRLLRENHVEDELQLSTGERVQLADISGDFEVIAEVQEDFPVSWSQRRATFMQLASGQGVSPELAARFLTPENDEAILRYLGLTDIVIAGKAAREKQQREIALLLSGIPVPVDPMDDHGAETLALVDWHQTDEGMEARASNPNYMLVVQHFLAHLAAQNPMPTVAPGAPAGAGAQPGALPFDPAQQPGPAVSGPEVMP